MYVHLLQSFIVLTWACMADRMWKSNDWLLPCSPFTSYDTGFEVDHPKPYSSLQHLVRIFQMMELLKEQLFQKQVAATEEEEEEEEEEWDDRRRGVYRPRGFPRSYSSGSWAELPRTPRLRRPYSSSTSHLPISPAASDSSYEQVRKLVLWIQMLPQLRIRKECASGRSWQAHTPHSDMFIYNITIDYLWCPIS